MLKKTMIALATVLAIFSSSNSWASEPATASAGSYENFGQGVLSYPWFTTCDSLGKEVRLFVLWGETEHDSEGVPITRGIVGGVIDDKTIIHVVNADVAFRNLNSLNRRRVVLHAKMWRPEHERHDYAREVWIYVLPQEPI